MCAAHTHQQPYQNNTVSDLQAAGAAYLYLMNSSFLGSFKSHVKASRARSSFRFSLGKVLCALGALDFSMRASALPRQENGPSQPQRQHLTSLTRL